MKAIILLFCIGLIVGCSSTIQEDSSITRPELLERYPLPSIPSKVDIIRFTLDMRILIDEHGVVRNVLLQNSIGDEAWDKLATGSIMKWKFTPALYDGKPYKVWVRQQVSIKLDEPVYMTLAEIMCDSYEDASRVVEALDKGKDFGELASQVSIGPSKVKKGVLGKVDIHCYSDEIASALKRLKVDEHSDPLHYGQKFVIFKRISETLE
ncbi:MAG: energy transducer TonB [Bacteroidota bacterium]|nr:energy transducer TonB [Bacteroidota bacterium]MDP4191869.1 energy transducer TonB [Bacteroidota bacterium]MDP4196672.1 energy transducer TonB [Bacteroidota bacterium]